MNMVALLSIPIIIRYQDSPIAFWIGVAGSGFLLILMVIHPKVSKEEQSVESELAAKA